MAGAYTSLGMPILQILAWLSVPRSLVSGSVVAGVGRTSCTTSTYLPNMDNCHFFWHCDQGLTEAKSCGFMMWNPTKQVCDWPNKVVQLRPECRDEAKLTNIMAHPWQRDRTQRMLRFLGPRTHSIEAIHRGDRLHQANPERQRVAVESLTEMINNRIREQISQRVPKAVDDDVIREDPTEDNSLDRGEIPEETRENRQDLYVPPLREETLHKKSHIKPNKRKSSSSDLRNLKKFLLKNRKQLLHRRSHLASRKKHALAQVYSPPLKVESTSYNPKKENKKPEKNENYEADDLTIGIKMGFNDNDFVIMNEAFSSRERLDPDSNKLLLLKSVVQQVKNEVEEAQKENLSGATGTYIDSNNLRYN